MLYALGQIDVWRRHLAEHGAPGRWLGKEVQCQPDCKAVWPGVAGQGLAGLAMVWQGVEQQSLAWHGLAWQAGPRATGKVSERDTGLDWRVQKAPYSKAVGAL